MKIKPITLCAVIDKTNKLSYFNIFQARDKKEIKLKKGEKIISVEVIAKK
jgi:hypothetical protein